MTQRDAFGRPVVPLVVDESEDRVRVRRWGSPQELLATSNVLFPRPPPITRI